MNNSASNGGNNATPNGEQIGMTMPMNAVPSNFDQLNPTAQSEGGFDSYIQSGAVLSPDIAKPTETLSSGNAEVLNGGEQIPSAENIPSGEQLAAPEGAEQKPKGYESEAVAEQRQKAAKEAAAREEAMREMPPQLDEAKAIDIPRDMKSLPPNYMAAAENGVDKALKDGRPDVAVKFMDELRWDTMKKTFGRDLGQGLNGTGA